jgi:hypothetical protein
LVEAECGPERVRLQLRVVGPPPARGDTVTLAIPRDCVHLFDAQTGQAL